MSSGRLSFSVIIASRDRPTWLRRCLTAVRQLDYPDFEVVVVSNDEGLSVARPDFAKRVQFDVANLSAARNAAIAVAAGDVCAFIDDDAVPEPMWLRHHATALETTGAAASVGFVRGRNGISFQSRAETVGPDGSSYVESFTGDDPAVPAMVRGRALKLVGTNSVVRRDILADIGGFDPAFAWYLEDADLSLRLARAGHALSVAPLAEVHHGYAPSSRRAADRMPLDLYDIGRSSAVFLRRNRVGDADAVWARIVRDQRVRLIRHLVRGSCEPDDVNRLLKRLSLGFGDGLRTELASLAPIASANTPFSPVKPLASGHQVIACRLATRRKRVVEAEALARSGARVSLFSFSLTPVRHHVRYTDGGVWLQCGGQFGQSRRAGRKFRWCRFIDRVKEEITRVAKTRGIEQTAEV